jgi:chromosomal replication initiation ATPase DnaA
MLNPFSAAAARWKGRSVVVLEGTGMTESPLRAAAARARFSLGERAPPSAVASVPQAAGPLRPSLLDNATRADRPLRAEGGRAFREWEPPTEAAEHADPLEEALHRRLAGMLEEHTQGWAPSEATLRPEVPKLGMGEDGRPIWMQEVGAGTSTSPPRAERPWPWALRWTESLTFRSWVELDSNAEATTWADKIIQSPGRANPLLIHGPEGVGRSHLLHAIGQALLRRATGDVGFVRGHAAWRHDLEGDGFTLLDAWLGGACALLIDDIDAVAIDAEAAAHLHRVVDLALNLGVQVVVVTSMPPSLWPEGPLSRVMREGVLAEVRPPGPIDRLAVLRSLVRRHGLALEPDQLHTLAMEHEGWRSLENSLLQHDVRPSLTLEETQTLDLRTTASSVIRRALDVVALHDEPAGVDLTVDLPDLDDGWDVNVPTPEELVLSAPSSARAASSVLAVGRDPMVDELMTPHERERYLVGSDLGLSEADALRAARILEEVDHEAERRLLLRRHDLEDGAQHLMDLQFRMDELGRLAEGADAEALLDITDELQAIDAEVQRLTAPRPARLARLRPVSGLEDAA